MGWGREWDWGWDGVGRGRGGDWGGNVDGVG